METKDSKDLPTNEVLFTWAAVFLAVYINALPIFFRGF
jgi:ABC-type molybdate transport system permease subunit